MLPPTSHLPSIKPISTWPLGSLENAVQYLRLIYNPQVRGSRRRKAFSTLSEGKRQDKQDSEQDLDALRTDGFERAYSIKWLTALIAQCGQDSDEGSDLPEPSEPSTPSDSSQRRDALVASAASLLSTCAGTASAGVITRRLAFDLGETSTPITIELTDVPLDNQDYGSVGAQTWGACVMAEMIAEAPDAKGLPGFHQNSVSQSACQKSTSNIRCLELGAGTGLVSLVVVETIERLLLLSPNASQLGVDIVATDYYPSVLVDLKTTFNPTSPHRVHHPRSTFGHVF